MPHTATLLTPQAAHTFQTFAPAFPSDRITHPFSTCLARFHLPSKYHFKYHTVLREALPDSLIPGYGSLTALPQYLCTVLAQRGKN